MNTKKIVSIGNGVGAQDVMAFGQKYTNANAISAINANGLAIATTKLLAFDDGGSVDIIRDEDDMASDDVNALATQQSIKKYTDDTFAAGGNASMATGNYTGNNVNNRQFTGLGFTPKYMIILEDRGGGTCYSWFKSDTMTQWLDYRPALNLIYNAGHIDLIADGFEVDNNDGNNWLNISGMVYHWVAWG